MRLNIGWFEADAVVLGEKTSDTTGVAGKGILFAWVMPSRS